jgi:hypothetical protein
MILFITTTVKTSNPAIEFFFVFLVNYFNTCCNYQTKCRADGVRNKQLSLLICIKTENLWYVRVFTPEYKNRKARLASLERMVREMNKSTEQGQLNWSTVYPIAAGQLGTQLLSNWLASNWHRVNRPLLPLMWQFCVWNCAIWRTIMFPNSPLYCFNGERKVIHIFTAVSRATHTESFKIQNLNCKTLNWFSFYVLFNTSVAQHVSAYLAIIRRIKIAGGIAALLYTVITRVDAFS